MFFLQVIHRRSFATVFFFVVVLDFALRNGQECAQPWFDWKAALACADGTTATPSQSAAGPYPAMPKTSMFETLWSGIQLFYSWVWVCLFVWWFGVWVFFSIECRHCSKTGLLRCQMLGQGLLSRSAPVTCGLAVNPYGMLTACKYSQMEIISVTANVLI